MVLNQNEIIAVMLTALSAMAKIGFIGAAGWVAAKYPISEPFLSSEAIRNISRICNFVLIPALTISSIGSSISPSLLSRIGILILFSLTNSFVSYSLANTLGITILGNTTKPQLSLAIIVAIGSPNIIAFPLMVLQTLCGHSTVNTHYDNNQNICFADATSMLFVYSIGWNIIYWAYGYPCLQSLHTLSDKLGHISTNNNNICHKITSIIFAEDAVNTSLKFIQNTFGTHNMIAIYIGVFIGLISPIQEELFSNDTFWSPLGAALRTLGEPVVCLHTLVMWASLAKVDLFAPSSTSNNTPVNTSANYQQIQPINAGVVNVLHSTSSSSQHSTVRSEFDDVVSDTQSSPHLLTPTTATTTLSNSLPILSCDEVTKPHWRAIVSLFICRLIIPGLLIIPILIVFVQANIIHTDDRMLQLVIILEAVAPPAQMVIVSLNQLGLLDVASLMAYLYLFLYIGTVFTMTAWVTFALSVIYG